MVSFTVPVVTQAGPAALQLQAGSSQQQLVPVSMLDPVGPILVGQSWPGQQRRGLMLSSWQQLPQQHPLHLADAGVVGDGWRRPLVLENLDTAAAGTFLDVRDLLDVHRVGATLAPNQPASNQGWNPMGLMTVPPMIFTQQPSLNEPSLGNSRRHNKQK